MENSDKNTEIAVEQDHEHSHQDCGDQCSPFCYCSCCGSSILIPNYAPDLSVEELPPLAQTTPQLASQMHGINLLSGIWQPPQFA